jgi:hypothetical protein
MNRTLRRPMFRMGGSTGEGITSGLQAPRQNYEGGKTVEELNYKSPLGLKFTEMDLSKFKNSGLSDKIRNMKVSDYLTGDRTIGEMKDMASQLAYKPRGTNINDFLISMGLDLVSRPTSGNIFADVATSSKDPYKEYMAGKQSAAEQRYASESDLFKSMMEAQSDVLAAREEGKSGGKGWLEQWKFEQIPLLNKKIADLTQKEADGTLTDLEKIDLQNAKEQKGRIVQIDGVTAAWLKSDDADFLIPDIKKELLEADQGLEEDQRKYKGKNDIQLTLDAIAEAKRRLGYKDGGRTGYQQGNMVQPNAMQTSMPMDQGPQESQEMPEELQNIDYDTLRARLPQSITDDIVTLIANSAEAMEDFAMIQSQQDVDMFNNKYGVQLVVPSEA